MIKRTIFGLLFALTFSSVLFAQETVSVDLTANNGAATYRASGFLHGMNNTTPVTGLVSPQKPRLFRFDDNVSGNGGGNYGISPTLYGRIIGQGAVPMYILGNAWIDNVGGFNSGHARVVHSADLANFATMCATSTSDAIGLGQSVQWDIWNEPDIPDFWTGTEAEYQAAWKACYQAIRGVDSGQVIVGPSTCCSNSTGGGWIVDLLSYGQTNSVLPNILDFHEASFPPSQLSADVPAWKTYLAANYPSITDVAVSEYGQVVNYLFPGSVIQYMAAAERTQVYEASHTCWNGAVCETVPATLSEFLQLSQARNAIWYAGQGYGAITGNIATVTPSATVDGVAGYDSTIPQAYAVFGRAGAASTVTWNFKVPTGLIVSSQVTIQLSDIPNDNGTGSSGPVVISTANVAVVGGIASVSYAMPTNDAVTIQLTRPTAATTVYVDFTNGNDTNSGTSKGTPWKHAPGMQGCVSNCNITPAADTQIIFKGCVTWPNAAFTWDVPGSGSSGHPVYYGVDQTWWDATVSGCASVWNRPIFDLQGTKVTDALQQVIQVFNDYTTLDNFEIINVYDADSQFSGENQTQLFGWGNNILVENMYIHHWVDQFFSVGTGTLTAGSSTVTNFTPYGYSPMAPAAGWPALSSNIVVGTIAGCASGSGSIPQGGNGANVTAISGGGPYSITWTGTGNATANGTGCPITVGGDYLAIFAGNEVGNPGSVAQNNIVDGSDSTAAALNPYSDCGLTESNNQWCGATGIVEWRGPQIFRNNVFRYVASVAVGSCSEWSGNLMENIRLSTNASAHTNGVECLDDIPVNNATLFFGNVFRHGTNPNTNTPSGRWSIGLGAIQPSPIAGETAYLFNNIFYDVLQNAVFERGTSTGTEKVFNNSVDCGPSWNLSFTCMNPIEPADIIQNNYYVTTNGNPIGSCSGCTMTTNLVQTPATATGQGYTPLQTFAYSPTSAGGGTVGTGTAINTLTFCDGIGLFNSTAAAACIRDTPYAVGYNTSNHTVTIPDRTTNPRINPPDIGGYQFVGGGGSPAISLAPTSVAFGAQTINTTSGVQNVTLTNSGGAPLTIATITLGIGSQFTISANTCGATLAASANCRVSLTFRPTSLGAKSDTLIFTTNASTSPNSVPLTGTGTIFQFRAAAVTATGLCVFTTPAMSPAPQPGNVLEFFTPIFGAGGNSSSLVVSDNNGNHFTISPSSPSHAEGSTQAAGYILKAPSNIGNVFTATWTVTGGCPNVGGEFDVIDFTVAAGYTTSFDTDAASGTVTPSSNNNLPALTPAAAGELLFAGDNPVGNVIGVTGPWTWDNSIAEYIVNSTNTSTAVGFTASTVDVWRSIEIAIAANNSAAVSLSPSILAYGNQNDGTTSAPQTTTLTNTGGSTLTITSIALQTGTQYAISGNTCGGTLAASANCVISVTFTPTSAGAKNDSIVVTTNASSSPDHVSLTGTGLATAPAVQLSPATSPFGTQVVLTTSAPQTTTLTNTGSATLTISSIVLTTGTQFAISGNTCGGTLGVSASCAVSVTFTPTTVGAKTDSIVFTTNASSSPDHVTLTGTGLAPAAPAVQLSPDTLPFGNQLVLTTGGPLSATLKNIGAATLTISSIALQTGTQFAISANTCAGTLAASASCVVQITFTPTTVGAKTDSVVFTTNAASSPDHVSLTGTGTSAPPPPSTIAPTPTILAILNTAPSGTLWFCTDCAKGTSGAVCKGGGKGALAFRNGAAAYCY